LQEEFELLGAAFDDRGARADDAMRALRAALSQPEPAYHGEYYDFEGFLVDPCALQPHVPLWVGGRTYRSLRRAVELGDGWAPFGLSTAELEAMLQRARGTKAWADRETPVDVIVQNEHPLDPVAEPERVTEQLARFAGIGATGVNARFVHHSPAHYREQLAALATIASR
jgi:alkanesulfonate monooxygenase SsuD/methylene tetrahydromethanopterin reductase-like flavin-dependent oxidoreductase (luciferase family)